MQRNGVRPFFCAATAVHRRQIFSHRAIPFQARVWGRPARIGKVGLGQVSALDLFNRRFGVSAPHGSVLGPQRNMNRISDYGAEWLKHLGPASSLQSSAGKFKNIVL